MSFKFYTKYNYITSILDDSRRIWQCIKFMYNTPNPLSTWRSPKLSLKRILYYILSNFLPMYLFIKFTFYLFNHKIPNFSLEAKKIGCLKLNASLIRIYEIYSLCRIKICNLQYISVYKFFDLEGYATEN